MWIFGYMFYDNAKIENNKLSVIILQIQNSQNSKMHSFQSPSRQSSNQNCQNVVQRQGDWICYHCNNLNFSFRKRCNRCKNQTKEQNQQISQFYKLGLPNFDERVLHDKTNTMPVLEQNSSSNRKYSDTLCYQYQYKNLNPEFVPTLYTPPKQNKKDCGYEYEYDCLKQGWYIFLSDQQVWEQNSLSDFSCQNQELDYQLDLHIEQMVIKLII